MQRPEQKKRDWGRRLYFFVPVQSKFSGVVYTTYRGGLCKLAGVWGWSLGGVYKYLGAVNDGSRWGR